MVKKTVRRARELELDDIMKMAEDVRKKIMRKTTNFVLNLASL